MVSGDNDVDLPVGYVVIKGGKFSGKAYNCVTNTAYEPEKGLSWVAIENDDTYKWIVE